MNELDMIKNRMIQNYIEVTDIIQDAGFLFPDGTLLSMTYEPYGEWELGHHVLIDYYDDLKEANRLLYDPNIDEDNLLYDDFDDIYDEAVKRYLNAGGIRLVPESPGFAISIDHKITKDQKMVLYDLVDFAKKEASEWSDRFHIDVHKPSGEWDHCLVYDIDKVSVQKIMKDLEPKQNIGLGQEK